MAGICFFYEDPDVDVWSGRGFDAWNYASKLAGDIDTAFVVNLTDQSLQTFDQRIDFRVFDSLVDAEAAMAGAKCYVTCPWNAGNQTSAYDFDHAGVGFYIFGPASGWHHAIDGVCLPQAGGGAVHAVHAATALMFTRYWSVNR